MLLVTVTLVGMVAVVVAISATRIARRMESTREPTPGPDPLLIGGMVNTIVGVALVATLGPISTIQVAVGFALIAIGSIRTRRSTQV